MNIILGSASRWRRELFKELGVPFSVMEPNIDEEAIVHQDPKKRVELIALAKAQALLTKIIEPSLLLTCDQVVVCHGEIRGKPKNAEDVRRYLQSYGQYPAQTYTCVVVTNTQSGLQHCMVDIAKVYFNPIPENIIDQAIKEGHVFHCAGGFQIEGDALFTDFIKKIEGDLDSIKGLPLNQVKKMLQKLG